MRILLITAFITSSLAGQGNVAVDRAISASPSTAPQVIEREAGGFLGDSFHLGAPGEIWIVDSIRVWAARNRAASCPAKLGDQIAKVTLYGALENAPVPGEPECHCHLLVPVRSVPLEKGSNQSAAKSVKISAAPDGYWQLDFEDVRWSLPGDANVLFTVRAAARAGQDCPAAREWSLSSAPSSDGSRLRKFDQDLVPDGFAAVARFLNVQVRAHRDQQ